MVNVSQSASWKQWANGVEHGWTYAASDRRKASCQFGVCKWAWRQRRRMIRSYWFVISLPQHKRLGCNPWLRCQKMFIYVHGFSWTLQSMAHGIYTKQTEGRCSHMQPIFPFAGRLGRQPCQCHWWSEDQHDGVCWALKRGEQTIGPVFSTWTHDLARIDGLCMPWLDSPGRAGLDCEYSVCCRLRGSAQQLGSIHGLRWLRCESRINKMWII